MKLDDAIEFELHAIRVAPVAGGEPRSAEYTGTKALMLAVLENGFRSYFSPKVRIRAEAERWVKNPQGRSPFSFTVVCETLGLEPDAVRDALRRLRANRQAPNQPPLKRSRPNVHRYGRIGS
jgi:alkanesulfonate monooxygenase SsuD/methylene tetrahydromethanopterin reductase-like flavin-dependent oxidoreductase (luciferase family)